MPSITKQGKARARLQPRYRIEADPDYDHPAWSPEGDAKPPTPQSEPDAFYFSRVYLESREKVSTRLKPHDSLSIGALRRRLARAGVRGAQVGVLAREIKQGPGILDLTATVGGMRALGWNVDDLKVRYGKHITRKVTRFVRKMLLVLDEFAYYMQPGMAEFTDMFRSMRKVNAGPILVEQSLADFGGAAA